MEAIRNYLETMFQSLPNTPEVQRAKSELWQMMEDKYTELKDEGKSENEAVGTVISEFGNLQELSGDLGIKSFIRPAADINRRMLSPEEAKQYLRGRSRQAYQVALGIFCCIISVTGPIFTEAVSANDAFGVLFLVLLVAIGVGLFIHPSVTMRQWDFLKHEPCATDFQTTNYVQDQRDRYRTTHALLLTVGIVLCVISFLPVILLDALNPKIWRFDTDEFGAVIMFFLIGLGVFMIVLGNRINNSFSDLLHINDAATVGGNFVPDQQENRYASPVVAAVMSVYWLTAACIYLCWSFLTFDWWITWILWPVAAVIHAVLNSAYKK